MDGEPLVSCIMPTYNRRLYAARALSYFLRQSYERKELVIVDDGSVPMGDLLPRDDRIRYVRPAKRLTIGAKRNLACELAQGSIIVHWDDDDWHAPDRLRDQVRAMMASGKDLCGITNPFYFEQPSGRAWHYVYPREQRAWAAGNSLAYKRSFWQNNRFADMDVGEDADFVWRSSMDRLHVMDDNRFIVGIIHASNASPKYTHTQYWHAIAQAEIQRLLGVDWPFYAGIVPDEAYRALLHRPPASRGAMIAACERDLALVEFAAYNALGELPQMRRWESPYALFAAPLDSVMTVLDCTINPVDFRERLAKLYPHVLYRHCAPIQAGWFVLPSGVPDGAFDRVVCVNTLEHLLQSQRAQLMAEMSRKLKPGGCLVLTADFYFESMRSNPHILALGAMRPDGAEIFNGWNMIAAAELVDLCKQNGLQAVDGNAPETPREDDAALHLHQAPYAHATIAGTFTKGDAPSRQRKRIVLALLTWNTRNASLESLCALVREAYMLERLGLEVAVCVVDNGSTDGTADCLRSLEPEIGVPQRVLCNAQNTGNSLARNQIIDYALEIDADYLLFMDGDIEIIPASSFAMFRYMENSGHLLGCIGADSWNYTDSRERATPSLYSLDGLQIQTLNLVAWTQYGLFRVDVFREGVRFDADPPFNGPGWGFEDNDLAFQMDAKGYAIQRFLGVTYLHRSARSSIRIMRQLGIDAETLFAKRRQRVVDKWSSVASIASGPLLDVQRVIALPAV